MENFDSQTFLDRLELLLRERHLSAAHMARDLGFSSGLFSQWKHDGRMPSSDKLCKMADYFGVPVDFLLGQQQDDRAAQLRRAIAQGLNGLEEPALERVLDYVRFTAEQQANARRPHKIKPFTDF